jgi:hypothetical protein
VVENSLEDPRFANNPLVTGPPYVIFYAGNSFRCEIIEISCLLEARITGAALIIEGVRIGSLCIIDRKPCNNFDIKQRMNLLDIGYAVSACIHERRRTNMNHNLERSHMMLSMMQVLRTPLFAMDMGVSVLQQEKDSIKKQVDACVCCAQNNTQSNARANTRLFCSTVEDLSASVTKLKMAVESTVILGKAFAGSHPSAPTQHSNLVTNSADAAAINMPPVIMASAVALDVDTFLSQMKMVASIIGGKRVSWGEHSTFLELLSAGKHSLSLSHYVVKSFPDGLNYVILSVLNHIMAHDFSDSPIEIDVRVVKCCPSANKQTDSQTDLHVDTTSRCSVCDSCPYTVTHTHGHLVMTIKSRCLRATNDNDAETQTCGNTQSSSELTLAELTLQNSIEHVLHHIAGNFSIQSTDVQSARVNTQGDSTSNAPTSRMVDCYVCELPFMVLTDSHDGVISANTSVKFADAPKASAASTFEPLSPTTATEETKNETAAVSESKKGIGKSAVTPLPVLNKAVAAALEQGPNEAPLQALIVDDSVLIQKMMKKWLEANGCIVSCAINGKIGLDMIKSQRYDIMLLDFLMVSPLAVRIVYVDNYRASYAACNVGSRNTGEFYSMEIRVR